MKVIISSFGSSGDFNPCLGLGRSLRARGVDVIFLSNPFYEKTITEAGFRFAPAGEYFDVFEEIRRNPDYLHASKGPPAVWKRVLKTVPVMHPAMAELIANESPDMVACHLLEYGGIIAAMNAGIPYATLVPTPMGWFFRPVPVHARYTPMPRWIRAVQAKAGWSVINLAFRYSLASHCDKQGISGCPKSIMEVHSKARLNLGLWSPLFRPPAKTDPPRSAVCGFVRDAHVKDWPEVPGEIVRLFKGPKRPVVVGLGSTASLHGALIYEHTVRACRALNWPCLLIGRGTAYYTDVDNQIPAVDFAPYGWVFPRAGLVIHHGGVNTTAEALRAGVPGLVLPHGYDQFDNAMRIEQMGLGRRFRAARVGSPNYTDAIDTMLHDKPMHERSKAFSQRLQAEPDGGSVAADIVIKAVSSA